MHTRYSVLLSATWILILSRMSVADNVITCKLPRNFTMEISKSGKAHFSQSSLTVILEDDGFILTSDSEMKSITIQAENVVVNFNGFINIEDDDPTRRVSSEMMGISNTYTNRISGIALRKSRNSSIIEGCRIAVLSTELDRPDKSERMANEIRRLAESCIELQLCDKIATMEPQYATIPPDETSTNFLFGCPNPPLVNQNCAKYCKTNTIQPIINKVVDVSLDEIKDKFRAINGGIYPVPNIEEEFSTGSGILQANGHFRAMNGIFRDLTTLQRNSSASIHYSGNKLIFACQFRFIVSEIIFPRYDVEYGIMMAHGTMLARMYDLALVIRVVADYNIKPCNLSVDHLKITKLGEMKIELTGLGVLNWIVSELLDWVTIIWRNKIVVRLENEMRATVEGHLSSVDCERIRPSTLDQ